MTVVIVTLKGFRRDADSMTFEVTESEQLRFLASKDLEEMIEEAFAAQITPVFELNFDQLRGFKLVTRVHNG